MVNDSLPICAKTPCPSCPYRRDAPPGIWHPDEYAKLPGYDGETWQQTGLALFFCHQQNGKLCAGWVGCHDTRHLLAVRLHPIHPQAHDFTSPVPLFASGAAAAAHGLSGVANPSPSARRAITRLTRKAQRRANKTSDNSLQQFQAKGPPQ